MGLIRRLAVKSYRKEIDTMIALLRKANQDQLSILLVQSVWMRAMLEIEKNFTALKNDDGTLVAELHCYPIKEKETKEFMSVCEKKGHPMKSVSLSIWLHTLRSIRSPELADLSNEMWSILMESKPNWNKQLEMIRDEDFEMGLSKELVIETEKHARAILNCLPPKQLKPTTH